MEKNKSREQSTRSDVVRQLKAVRKEQHITQEVLAERAGTKKSNISRLESGRYNPSLDFLVKVAGCLEKETGYYYEEEQTEDHGEKY